MNDHDHDQDRHCTSELHTNGNDEGTSKRKSDDGSSYTRTKRNRYISLAWCRPPHEACLSWTVLTRVVMNARGGRSNATARIRVNVVAG